MLYFLMSSEKHLWSNVWRSPGKDISNDWRGWSSSTWPAAPSTAEVSSPVWAVERCVHFNKPQQADGSWRHHKCWYILKPLHNVQINYNLKKITCILNTHKSSAYDVWKIETIKYNFRSQNQHLPGFYPWSWNQHYTKITLLGGACHSFSGEIQNRVGICWRTGWWKATL